MDIYNNAPCEIHFVGKARSGRRRYWCVTHQADATSPNGPKATCDGSSGATAPINAIDLDPKDYAGGVALWGAVAPIYDTTNMPPERGVHLHARRHEGDEKEIDETFDVVRFPYGDDLIDKLYATVGGRAAVAYYLSSFVGNDINCVFCRHCGEPHLDEGEFAVKQHRRHLCHACGRYFDVSHRCVSNPIALLRDEVGSVHREPQLSERSLSLHQADYPGGIQLWASNPAIIWLANRSEEAGIHVHTYDATGKRIVDDTFGRVEIDGIHLPNEEVAHLMAQRTAPWLSDRVAAVECAHCSKSVFSRGRLAFQPTRKLACSECGSVNDVRGRTALVSNPLVAKLETLRRNAARGVDERLYLHHGDQH